ncbi:nucleoside deaminase [Streptomyces sp. NPDC101393]|uniref:nucleoside deaminase n=1 Tax=Streptomyces sp. NPDC101393 TaxID=3366141 RepID=UPI00381B38EA
MDQAPDQDPQDWAQDRDELRLHGTAEGVHHDPAGHRDHLQEQARAMLATAVAEAREGLAEGGIPIGAALYGPDGALLGCGRNRRVQDNDPSLHAETDAFRAAGRQHSYRGTTMVTTLSPCWYCSGLVRQFGISRVVIGEARTFHGGHDWLARHGVRIVLLDDLGCAEMMRDFIGAHPALWNEDIGNE